MNLRNTLVFGSRKSELALWQTRAVIKSIRKLYPDIQCEIRPFSTRGDSDLSKPIPEFRGKGLFTAELDSAILTSEIDVAIHSLKDLPVEAEAGLEIIPVLDREDTRDVLISRTGCDLASLPPDSVVGTSSIRRRAQLLAIRPDLVCQPIRGNVPTRIKKVRHGDFDAAVLAAAGVIRLGLQPEIAQWLTLDEMLPAPGQAMIAGTCRRNDEFVRSILGKVQNKIDARCVMVEREILQQMGGGCSAPVASHARWSERQAVSVSTRICLPDGTSILQLTTSGGDPIQVSHDTSQELRLRGAQVYLRQTASLPLSGKRIVVTRAARQNDELCALLENRGAKPLAIPAIEIQPLSNVDLPTLAANDWILFTSSNGVRTFAELLKQRSVSVPQEAGIACIGSATAKAGKQHGLEPHFVPRNFTGDDFAHEFLDYLQETSFGGKDRLRVVYPSAQKITSKLIELLKSSGLEVLRLPVYQSLPVNLNSDSFAELAFGVDALTFASPSAVNSLCSQIKQSDQLAAVMAEVVMACIGETTAAEVRSFGYKERVVTAKRATVPALVAALDEFFTEFR